MKSYSHVSPNFKALGREHVVTLKQNWSIIGKQVNSTVRRGFSQYVSFFACHVLRVKSVMDHELLQLLGIVLDRNRRFRMKRRVECVEHSLLIQQFFSSVGSNVSSIFFIARSASCT